MPTARQSRDPAPRRARAVLEMAALAVEHVVEGGRFGAGGEGERDDEQPRPRHYDSFDTPRIIATEQLTARLWVPKHQSRSLFLETM